MPGACCRDDPTGKTPAALLKKCAPCPASGAKIYAFPKDRTYDLTKPARASKEGRFAIATTRGAGCDGRVSAARRAARRVRSSRVVLSRQCRGQACEIPRRRRWQKSWFAEEITEQP